jgi:protein-disulfide isomerase
MTTSLVVRRELFPDPRNRSRPEATVPIVGRPVPPGTVLPTTSLIDDTTAALRIVEFADFQCPFCADAAGIIERVSREHPGRFAIEFHHMPISGHSFARPAAEAADCAAAQHRFGQFYSTVYRNQSKLGEWTWLEFGKRAGLTDLAEFEACLASKRNANHIDADVAAAIALGVRGTPTWLVHDSLYGGVPTREQVLGWIQAK